MALSVAKANEPTVLGFMFSHCRTCKAEDRFLFKTGECGGCYCDRRLSEGATKQ